MSEKYGFVYLWYDKKHKRFYIGSHWGSEDDRYVCSSNWMRKSYSRRKQDFKRKILKTGISNRKELLLEEHRWLSLIKKEELGKRYYNLRNTEFNHWSTDDQKLLTLPEKISLKTKEAMQRPDVRENYLNGLQTRNNTQSEETRQKRSKSLMGKRKGCDNSKAIAASVAARKGKHLSEAHILKVKETTHFNTINNKKVKCRYCEFEGNVGNVARYHNDKCKRKM